MDRPLRWHERLLIRLLLLSPRIDKVLIVQYGQSAPELIAAERAQLQLEQCRQHLERLYRQG